MNTTALPAIGAKAKVASSKSVAGFLHGKTGTITEHRYSHTEGQEIAVLTFDKPAERHWSPTTPLKTIGLRADQLTTTP